MTKRNKQQTVFGFNMRHYFLYLIEGSRLLTSHPSLRTGYLLLLQRLCQQVASATHALVPKAHPGGAVHHLTPHHPRLLLGSIVALLLGSHHGPAHAAHHPSYRVLLLLLLHHAGLLLGGQVLLRPLARGRLHVAQVLPHGGGPSWVAHGTRVVSQISCNTE